LAYSLQKPTAYDWFNSFFFTHRIKEIVPIIGCEIYVNPRGREYRQPDLDAKNYHLVLLAQNNDGLKNLFKITSEAWSTGLYYKPRADYQLLKDYSKGIIASSACLGGEVAKTLLEFGYDRAKEVALTYMDIFNGNFYLELQDHNLPDQRTVANLLIKMSEETGIPLITANDCHYTNKNSWQAHDVLMAIQSKTTVDDPNFFHYTSHELYIKSGEEMRALGFPEEAYANTRKIADMCETEVEHGVFHLPKFKKIPDGMTAFDYFKDIVYKGILRKYDARQHEEAFKRADYELKVINDMGYTDYFLIVWDFLEFNRQNVRKKCGVDVESPGRVSVGGSIVAYTMDISQVDPLKSGTIFERFLNPNKASLPDIDCDIPDFLRQDVIDYVQQTYGYVVQIITHSTLSGRSLTRYGLKAQGFSLDIQDKVAKAIPLGSTLKDAFENKALTEFHELIKDADIRKALEIVLELEGLTGFPSTLASGVIICDQPIDNFIPLQFNKGKNGKPDAVVSAVTMGQLEDLGLLKMDFLGLKNLRLLIESRMLIKELEGVEINQHELWDCADEKP
jgi:DNA polymerase-3 subunit alpha